MKLNRIKKIMEKNRIAIVNTPRMVFMSSLLVGLFADVRSINRVLVSFLPLSEEGIMAYIYLAILFGVLVLCIKYSRIIKLSSQISLLISLLFLFYFITLLFIGQPEVSFLDFIVFTICAFALPCLSCVDGKILLRTMILAPAIGILRVGQIFVLDDIVGKISMGLSYAFLPPVIATIVYFFCYFKYDSRKWKIIVSMAAIINLIYLFRMMMYGSRGPVLAILGVILFVFLIKKKETLNGVKARKLYLFLGIVVFLLLILFFEDVLNIIDVFLSRFNINMRFVEKTLILMGENNIDHDRSAIASLAWRGIIENPLFGNGLDRFMANTGITYPHNFVLQILYDGGLVLFCLLLLPISRGVIKRYKQCSIGEYAVLTTLFFSSVPGASFSGDMWRQALLWLFMGAALTNGFVYKNINKIKQ